MQLATFHVSSVECGLPIDRLREIIEPPPITRVPGASPAMRGLTNLRGRVIPVIDLRLKFGMEATAATEQTVVIVVQCRVGDRTLTMGVLVDLVLEVLSIDAGQIEPPPDLGAASIDGQFIRGVGKAGERVVFLLDIARVLSGADAATLGRAAQA